MNLNFNYKEELINGDTIIDIISLIRKEKSENNLSLKTIIDKLDISCSNKIKESIENCIKDFKATLTINELIINDLKDGYKINNIKFKAE